MTTTPSDPSSVGSAAHPADETEARLVDTIAADFSGSVADLARLVRIPSVSWDGFDPEHVATSATAIAALAESTGVFESVSIERVAVTPGEDALGQPAVLARRPARGGAPTVLLYAHHDVQPEGDEALWQSPPFEPTVRGDRLYGRGASDDKAGVMTHIAALRALNQVHGDDFDLGVVLFVEGEEEFGSRSFGNFLATHRDTLAADVIVVADSDNWDTATPALTVSLRGNVTFVLTVSTLDHASHSGMFGGAAPDAMLATIRLLSTLWNEDGTVAVDGLTSYSAIDAPHYKPELFREEAALLDGVEPLGGGDLYSQMWFRPAITVTGIDAPTVRNASNTLSPQIRVRISARIAPGQRAADALVALRSHLEKNAPFGAHLAFDDIDAGDPFLVDTGSAAFRLASRALADGWGAETVEQGIGGSIPFIAQLVETFPDAQILVTGVEDPDTRAHSPNESQHLGVLKRAITGEALLLHRLAGGS
ncbi:dipeptidase [Amnibacterium flavum]|uniref:Dipeptidase n=1 Tax=Amnibacterium flavum TaxID=2173173 RepID=A0A2V1HQ56_9MICO|nr:dipeptidase [Amnibacterium flavum]PVZ94665.1 dipeptidase [Amnibacterium flavum]